ncbi:MAG: efflux RND transporter periplasmic adaptor subunit [Verrucomicrobiales bacterium]|nr:efflux RND transporter periplasmic adaptor subunit [Verrucomicrobiales bacterium]
MKFLLSHLLAATLAAAITWFAVGRHPHEASQPPGGSERKILYYQSPMHPWVKSDQPGRCTVCGMALVPVYEGDADHSADHVGLVILPPGSPSAAQIQTDTVKRGKLQRTLRVAGIVEEDDSKHRILSAYIPGRIESLHVNYEGAEVAVGQPLATFYSRELLGAAGEYKLLAAQGGAALDAVKLKLRQFGLSPDQIARIPERKNDDLFFDILAPVSGTVVKRSIYQGQYVTEGAPLFELADFSTMWFQFIAYEQDLALLKAGQKVQITTPTLPGKTLEATVKFINPNLDSMTRSAKVRVEIPNPNRELRNRVYADAEVLVDAPEALIVSRSAVLWSGTRPRVYVEKDQGAYELRTVRLGRSGDAAWEVLEGLTEGEKVVASGNMLIDSQAQIDGITAPSHEHEPHPPAVLADAAAMKPWEEYLRTAATLSAALAQGNLKEYNGALAALPVAPDMLASVVPPAPAGDIKSARRNFLPWSQAVSEFALGLRGKVPSLRVLQCPMTADLWEGAPPKARWVQFSTGVQNPFWGDEMLDCGSDVK